MILGDDLKNIDLGGFNQLYDLCLRREFTGDVLEVNTILFLEDPFMYILFRLRMLISLFLVLLFVGCHPSKFQVVSFVYHN